MCSGFQLSKVCATAQSVGQSPSTLLGNTSPNPRPVYVEFVVDNLTLGQTLSQYLGYPLSLSPHKRSHHHPTNAPIITPPTPPSSPHKLSHHHPTNAPIITPQTLPLSPHKLSHYHPTNAPIITPQTLPLSPHQRSHYHPTNAPIISPQTLPLSPHKRSHHHPTNDPIITLTCKPILLLLEIPTDATFRRLKKL